MKRSKAFITLMGFLTVSVLFASGASVAADTVTVAIGQRGDWETAVTELGARAGIFQKHGLKLKRLYTEGGGETMQAVISGSANIGVAVGTLGVIGAYAKGAPVRIFGSQTTGDALYWYVRSDSKLKNIKNATPDMSIAYSTHGSSTNDEVLSFVRAYGLKSQLVPTGGAASTFTQVMSGQVDIGWAPPPFGLNKVKQGDIRIVAKANSLPEIQQESVRSLIVNKSYLDSHRDILKRYLAAYRQTLDWMYSSDKALNMYAKFSGFDKDVARDVREHYFTKEMLLPDQFKGIRKLSGDAVKFNIIDKTLSDKQIDSLLVMAAKQNHQ